MSEAEFWTGTLGTSRKPQIDASDGDVPRLAFHALEALQTANSPARYFRHGGLPARIERTDEGETVIASLSAQKLRHELGRVADWYRPSKDGPVPAPAPMLAVNDLLATSSLDLPLLTRVIHAPAFGADGTLHSEPGYNPRSRTFYAPDHALSIETIPAEPTSYDVDQAADLILSDLIVDFPFTSESERANAVAYFLLPFARDLVAGPTPLHLFEKPAPGTGGSLLVETLSYAALGGAPAVMTEGRDEDEWRKRLTSRLATGPAVILIDNLRRRLESAALSAALTSLSWTDRILGRTEVGHWPVRCAWVATGNNPSLSTEIARRALRCRLDAHLDKPWMREPSTFKHPDLRRWTHEHRADLCWAALVLVQAWLTAGRPPGEASLGSYESWSDVIGGTLALAGIPGFLANRVELYEAADAEGEASRALVELWWETHADAVVTVADLFKLADSSDVGLDLGTGNEQSRRTLLGTKLRECRDRRFGPYRVVMVAVSGGGHRGNRYALQLV
jgi:putative DNA primase/helicase